METLTEELRMTVEETAYRSKKFSDFRTIATWECTCSSCGNVISSDLRAFNSHPVLGILQCQPCADQFRLLQSNVDEDTIKVHCLICARNNPSSIYTCTGRSCNFSFCKRCIKRNAANTLLVCEKSDWRCFVCNTKPLWQRRGVCAVMMASSPRRSKKKVSTRQRYNDSNDSSEESTTQSKKNEKQQSTQSSSQLNKIKKPIKKNNLTILLLSDNEDDGDFTDVKIIKPTKTNPKKINSTQINSKRINSTQVDLKKINSTQVKTKKKAKSSNNDFQKKKIINEPLKKSRDIRQSNIPRVEALSRMNSDSSSGKEFTQTKILKESYVSLQKLDSIHENIPSSMERSSGNVLSTTEALNLKTTTQKYFDDLTAVSKKLLNDIETAKKFYMKKDVIKPIDATQFIVECKNIACSLIKRTEANEKKLINQYSKWCKKAKVKNIFNNPIKSSLQVRKRSVSGTKERSSSSSSLSSASSSDEEDEKKEEKIVVKKNEERELEVSECDSEEIFSGDETRKTQRALMSSSIYSKNNKKQNLETSGIESEDSNENNSDIETNLFSPKAGVSSLMQKSKDSPKKAGKSDDFEEDISSEDDNNINVPVASSKIITNISDDSAEDEALFSSPDSKKKKSKIISRESKREEKTKKRKSDLMKEGERRVKAKLVNSTSDSSDAEETGFKISQRPIKTKEFILDGTSDSDDEMTVKKTAKKNNTEKYSSDDEMAESASGAKKIIPNGLSDSEDTRGNKKKLRKDGKSPEKSSEISDADKSADIENQEKQKKSMSQIDSDSTDVDESAPKRPDVISDASEGETTEQEDSRVDKLSKKNSGLKNKETQKKSMSQIDSDSTDVDESAPKRPDVISDASEGETTEQEDSKANKLSKKNSGLDNKEKQKKYTDQIDSDSTDVDESAPKRPDVISDASEDEATEREASKNSKELSKNNSDSEASTDIDETLPKELKNPPSKSVDRDETESLKALAPENSSSDQEEWADAEDMAARKVHSQNSNSTEYEEFEPAQANNSKGEKQATSDDSENSDDDDDNNGPEKNKSKEKEALDSVSKKTSSSSSPKSSDAEETVDEEEAKKKLLATDSSDGDNKKDSSSNESSKAFEHSYSKRKKSSSSQVSKNDSDSDSPKQSKKKQRLDNEENIRKKLLISSSESDEEIDKSGGDKSSKNDSNSPKQNEKNSQLNEENSKKKLFASSSESDKEINKSRDDKSSKNDSNSPKQNEKNSQLDNEEENSKKKLFASSSESDEEIDNSRDDKSSKSDSDSPKQNEENSQLDNEEKNRNKLLASSSESSEEAKKSNGDKSSDEKKKNDTTEIKNSSVRSRLTRKFRIKNNQYYKSDAKLRSKCMVKVQRIPPRTLRKHAKALKKSKEYVENKKLESLIALDDLEKNRNRDREMNSSSEEEETSTSTRNRRKKTAKESEETLMDHLKNLNNGDTMDVDDSVSEDEEGPENPQRVREEVTDLDEAADKIAQNNILRDSSSNSEEEVQDSDAEEETKAKESKKKSKSNATVSSKKNNSDENNDSDIEMEDQEESNDGNKDGDDDKGRWRRNTVLTTNISSSDSDEQAVKVERKSSKLKSSQELENDEVVSDDETEKMRNKRARRQRVVDSDSDVKITDFSSNSDSDAVNNEKKTDNEKSKKKRTRRKKGGNDSSDSDLSSTTRGKQKAKRRRIKTADTDSDDDDDGDSSVEEINNSQGTPSKSGRKNIRRVLKDTKVADDTKQAAMQEEERLKRMADRQKIYNEMYEVRLAGEKKVDNLVLDFDEESKEELLSVHENLVKKLKPHQAQGIKFMWDACFESLERAKTTIGSGAILAHCMGLGKSFQIVTLSHTLLAHNEKTGVKTVMVVCPLSTVLNWVNEFSIWLKEINGDEDEIEVYEMTKMKKNFERKYVLEKWQKTGGVLIIGYEMFRNLSSGGKKVPKKIRESFLRCLVEPGPDLVVCDEGHLLKSENTATSKAMSRIRTLRRIVLTGTPLQNNLIEYHCMVQFVKPNLLGTKKEFLNRFVNPINNGQFDDSTEYDVKLMKKRAHVLHKMLEGSVQRFDYSVLTPFLPPKQEYVIFVKLSEVQVKLYQYYIENLARRHRAAGGSLFADFQALQRVWTHPICIKLNADKDAERKRRNNDTDSEGSLKDFIDDDDDSDNSSSSIQSVSSISGSEGGRQGRHAKSTRANPLPEEPIEEPQPDPEWWSQFVEEDHFEDMRISSKLLLLFDILKESENIGDKVLVFSQSLYSLTLIERFLAMLDDETQKGVTSDYLDGHTGRWKLGLDYFRLDGQTSTENRSQWCKSFNRPTNTRARLFLISTRAGGLGINLTAANRVIIFDASWNPSHDVQSIFRIYRFGQKKPCYVYRLLAAGTMEEKIYNRQVTKLSLSCRVVDEQQIERHYSNNDLAELYKYEETDEETVSLALPKDRLLAEIFLRHKNLVRNYHEHDSLLENKAEEELDEEERKQAWREYEDEKAGRRQVSMPMMNYQDPMMQQFNTQMMNQTISQLPEFEQIRQLIQKDYPNATPEQQLQITKQAMVNMYAYIENQHLMRNVPAPVVAGRPPLQLPQAAPMLNQQSSKPPNPTNTLANMLAQQEYARHHNTSSKKMSAQQKQIQYAQQFGNFRSVPVPSNARPAAAPTPQRSTNSVEPEVIELESPIATPASTSNSRKGKKKFQEE